MDNPVQVTFRGIERSPAIEKYVRLRAKKLGTFSERIIGCHVTLDAPHRHRRHGRPYHVHINVTVPGAELFVGRAPDDGTRNEDAYAAIDDAFEIAGRVLQDHARKHGRRVRNERARRALDRAAPARSRFQPRSLGRSL